LLMFVSFWLDEDNPLQFGSKSTSLAQPNGPWGGLEPNASTKNAALLRRCGRPRPAETMGF